MKIGEKKDGREREKSGLWNLGIGKRREKESIGKEKENRNGNSIENIQRLRRQICNIRIYGFPIWG